MTERRPPALRVGVGSAGLADNASAVPRAASLRGVGAIRLHRLWFLRDLRGQASSMSARCARRARSVINTAQTAGASAAASVRADPAQRVTNRSRSPIFSPKEVVTQIQPDPRRWGIPMAASGANTHDRRRGDLAAATGEDLMNVLQAALCSVRGIADRLGSLAEQAD